MRSGSRLFSRHATTANGNRRPLRGHAMAEDPEVKKTTAKEKIETNEKS